jgi:hypothetical protein
VNAYDRAEDGFPHGTPDGYRAGCRGGVCPAPMPCRDVYTRHCGDYGFRRRFDAGVPLAEIVAQDAAEQAGASLRDSAAARALAERASGVKSPKVESRPARVCTVEGCDRRHSSRGLCVVHYYRMKRTGTTDARFAVDMTQRRPRSIDATCERDECDRPHKAKGLCSVHYARSIRGLPLDAPIVTRERRRCAGTP